jgi:hypothetical protein
METRLEVQHDNRYIYFYPIDKSIVKFGSTDFSPELMQLIVSTTWRIRYDKGIPKYIVSSSLRRSLHQVVYDFYNGYDASKKASKNGYVIDHIDHDGFNCKIQNLSLLLKIDNTIKGFYFDLQMEKMVPIMSLRAYNVQSSHTFQIVITFNKDFVFGKLNHIIDTMYLLYSYDYDIVIQDGVTILKFFKEKNLFTITELQKNLRNKKLYVMSPEQILYFGKAGLKSIETQKTQ